MGDHPAANPRDRWLQGALWGAALLGVAAVVYIIAQASTNRREETAGAPPAAVGGFAGKLTLADPPIAPPDYVVQDAAGKPVRLADLKGKVVVLNVWATWCGPCKIEMPTLAKLQAAYAGKPVRVMAVSIDSADKAAQARLFIAAHAPLAFYHDAGGKLPWALKPAASGVPTTVILGPDGKEHARVSGEADWTGPEARALIDGLLKG